MIIKDFTDKYAKLVTFAPNKKLPIHRWYPLVEGYSSKLVKDIIMEENRPLTRCLDPFGGVGTTAITCQSLNIDYISIESNPFFYDVAQVKLNAINFSVNELEQLILKIKKSLSRKKGIVKHPILESKTFFESSKRKKWIFHQPVSNGIFDIINAIELNCKNGNERYKNLLKLSLSTILQETSNVFKNGKCLSYKKKWREKKYTRKNIHELFIKHLYQVILKDIRNLNAIQNKPIIGDFRFGDSRNVIKNIDGNIDLVITSPPYLNSRDYTDIYRLELWILGYVSDFKTERKIRARALTSHVQIPLPEVEFPNISELKEIIIYLEDTDIKLWNKNIPNMVKGYFKDMENLLIALRGKLNLNAKLYINVSNSSYANKIIEVDVIIGKIAELIGYRCEEIRVARYINTSSQQNISDKMKMRESIIVLRYLGI